MTRPPSSAPRMKQNPNSLEKRINSDQYTKNPLYPPLGMTWPNLMGSGYEMSRIKAVKKTKARRAKKTFLSNQKWLTTLTIHHF